MSEVVLLYLFTRLDAFIGIGHFLILAGVIGMIVFGIIRPAWIHDFRLGDEGLIARSLRSFRLAATASVVGVVISTLIPNKADMAIIIGGKIALDASRTDTAKEISQEVLGAIRSQLKKAQK